MSTTGKQRGPMHFPIASDVSDASGAATVSTPEDAALHRTPRALPAEQAQVVEPVHDTETRAHPEQTSAALASSLQPVRWPVRLLGWVAGLLASLALALAIDGLLRAAFARADWLGWLAAGIVALGGLAVLTLMVREVLGLRRLKRITRLRQMAEAVAENPQATQVTALRRQLMRLYAQRADMRWAFDRLAEHDPAILSATEQLQLLELEVMQPLDVQARRIILRAARDVAGLTAIVPAAALDVLIVALRNLRMLRQLAALYGGRPGFLGGWKLARMVLGHMAVTGAIALSDAFLPHLLGKGLAGRLSARFGEGVVNGVLTARIGLAALEFVRPLPFHAMHKPGLKELAKALTS